MSSVGPWNHCKCSRSRCPSYEVTPEQSGMRRIIKNYARMPTRLYKVVEHRALVAAPPATAFTDPNQLNRALIFVVHHALPQDTLK